MSYNHREIEKKWQEYWHANKCFDTKIDISKPKYYVLEMFPYPSGKVHMGHVRNYALGDVISRFKRANQFNVLHPMGWDAFGLPAENAAIANKVHPAAWTFSNIDSMRKQLLPLGFDYDWNREFATCVPQYYKHEQAMFIDFLEVGLAYQKEAVVNWDPVDCTVLANEQVENGRGWRSGALIERRKMKQWFLRTTAFVDELLLELENLKGWPENVVLMQHNWIGKSYGANINFKVEGIKDPITVYSTRPDTLFGASFIALAADHPFVAHCKDVKIQEFVEKCKHIATTEQAMETLQKEGVDTGYKAKHPITGELLPIYIANFVLMDYGTGAIFGCPGHDERDHEFALRYNLPIYQVVGPQNPLEIDVYKAPYTENGRAINSQFLDGLATQEAKEKMIAHLEEIGAGIAQVQYRLRDWGVSRQRYWGCPIPIIYCPKCGTVPIPKEQLPVTLPEDVSFDKPGNPLLNHPTWKHVKCHKCGQDAERDTDTFDTFFESSWYFIRFCAPGATEGIDRSSAQYWLPVDQYIGGIEHAVMHLLYARFFTKALRQCGYLDLAEPFTNLLTQGMICHETYRSSSGEWFYPEEVSRNGDKVYVTRTGEALKVGRIEKMSKSKKNTVDPDDMVKRYGADTVRLFSLSDSPPERGMEWSESGVEGAYRYLAKLYSMVQATQSVNPPKEAELSTGVLYMVHSTISNVTHDIESFHFNKAIARIRELSNYLSSSEGGQTAQRYGLPIIAQLLAPFTPHIAEEIWEMLGNKPALVRAAWPMPNSKYLKVETITLAVQINGKMRGTVELATDASQEEALITIKQTPALEKYLASMQIKKIIHVPNKIINLIISGA